MNLLLVHAPSDLYGASRSLLRLSRRLRADGHRVVAVLPARGPLAPELEQAGVAVECLPGLAVVNRSSVHGIRSVQFPYRLLASARVLARLIRREGIELVHTNTALLPSAGLAARRCGVPHVWHIRELFTEFCALWKLQWRIMNVLADRIVAVSGAVARQFPARCRGQVRIIHNGIPASELSGIGAESGADFRRRHGLEGALLVGLPGRINLRRKGQGVLLEAAARLRPRYPHARFLVIGSPFPGNEEHQRELERRIRDLRLEEYVLLTGELADMRPAYAALDVVTSCSVLPEALSGVVIEAMAMGKPVVGTAIGGTPEQVEDGVTGLLVSPGDPHELARALDRLLSDAELRRRMGEAGRRRFLERFEFEGFYRRMLAVYSELLGRELVSPTPVYAESLRGMA